MRFLEIATSHSCDHASRPFAPRSGEKVVRQHRMRGRGRWGAFAVAAVRTRRFIGCCSEEARKRPSSALPGTFSPSPRGEGTASVFSEVQIAILRWHQPSLRPAQRGEGTGMRFLQSSALHACDSASRPFAPRSGEKVVRQHRMRGGGRWAAIDVGKDACRCPPPPCHRAANPRTPPAPRHAVPAVRPGRCRGRGRRGCRRGR